MKQSKPKIEPSLEKPPSWLKRHKKPVIIIGVVVLVLGGGTTYSLLTKKSNPVTKVLQKKKIIAKPTTVASLLTGIQVSPELAERPLTASIIENHPDARPQSGLSDAGVVYEALAEGGITRFLAIYLENKPKEIGPIRSIRSYFVDWSLEYDAPLAHVGGNVEALDMIGPNKVKDMNQFYNAAAFYRSKDRYAPHNVYTTAERIESLQEKLGFDDKASFTPNARKADTKPTTATNPNIAINYSTNSFKVGWTYNAATNDYSRALAGQPHIDRNTNQQIKAKNVVVQFITTTYGKTRIGELATRMATPGSARILVFRDGGVVEGTWSKSAHRSRTKLLDATGKEIPLNAGNSWYNIVPVGNSITY